MNRKIDKWLKSLAADAPRYDDTRTAQQDEAARAAYWADRTALDSLVTDLERLGAVGALSVDCGTENFREAFPALTQHHLGYWRELRRFISGAAGFLFEDAGRNVNAELGYTIY